jgi:hypothetical protein
MSDTGRLPDVPATTEGTNRVLYLVVLLPTLLGAAHHIDHIIRGNHVGWPITAEVNPFTYTLAIYPLLAAGIVLTLAGLAGTRYWTVFFALSAAMLAYFHISPWAIEPPQDVIWPYANPVLGYLAFAVLLALIASVVVGSAYAAVLWRRGAS